MYLNSQLKSEVIKCVSLYKKKSQLDNDVCSMVKFYFSFI